MEEARSFAADKTLLRHSRNKERKAAEEKKGSFLDILNLLNKELGIFIQTGKEFTCNQQLTRICLRQVS